MAASAAAHEGSVRRSTAYARAELKALRGAPSEEAQARLWGGVRAALAAAGFSGEYDGLLAEDEEPRSRRGNKGRKAEGGRGRVGRKWGEETAAAAPRFSGVPEIGAWRNGDLGVSHEHCFEAAVHGPGVACGVVQEPSDQGEDVEYESDSDDDYDGILKPAFAVDGDPDFESGEPLDGFEYLRRVRWEAKQIPRVKVAKVDLNGARKEQTPYMPEIPDIPKCSPDLGASKQWEDAFITHFSETRLVFSEHDSSDEPSISGGPKISSKPGSSTESQTEPTLTMLRNMDSVARAATLRNYIDMIQSMDSLSRNNGLWLFALCVAVDTPLDAETCASLRSLLRKCATILATKSEMDDEVVMLNILMAISGRYFGQYENRCD
ncbi:LOW QUALITY PROTEIN: gem-associated protein 2-like [Setaria italica]|uniref:LOW QUALITY PROTEIN: gem-associated protein 2-like n=1 Tax=Setaria italica TaxID=4555 RepID=UPI000350BCAE|nr:LOW QUALITY PROTEIN: gem-associated protein 2-like [Setaria italica]